jgi:hypothetical protein
MPDACCARRPVAGEGTGGPLALPSSAPRRANYNGAVRTVTVRKFDSFEEAERADRLHYWSLTPEVRLRMMCELSALGVRSHHDPSPRLARVYRVVKLPRR